MSEVKLGKEERNVKKTEQFLKHKYLDLTLAHMQILGDMGTKMCSGLVNACQHSVDSSR